MNNVFEKMAPSYKRLVRRYALDIWRDRLSKKDEEEFLGKANNFKKRYERELVKYYRDKEIRIFPGTIREKANAWLVDQVNLLDSIKVIASAKKEKLTSELFEDLKKDQSGDVQKMLNKIYLTKSEIGRGEEVYKVFSFSDNLSARAEQLGEESAFDLGSDINHSVIMAVGDTYDWNTQEDRQVRLTHRKLNKKTFSYSDPPTTIDKYGNRHTGHCGTDYGCRCYETPGTKKPLKKYVVKA
jgi:hypothetical protein